MTSTSTDPIGAVADPIDVAQRFAGGLGPESTVPAVGPHASAPEPQPDTAEPASRSVLGDPGALARISPSPARVGSGVLRRRHDVELDVFDVGALHVAAASLRGLSHHHRGAAGQDAFALGLTVGDEWLVCVVADGVSQAALSDVAADLVCRELLRAAIATLPAGADPAAVDWRNVVAQARSALLGHGRRLVSRLGRDGDGQSTPGELLTDRDVAEHLATTAELLMVRTAPTPEGVHPVLRVRVAGDSSAYLLDVDSGWRLISAGKDPNAEVASNAVLPLPLDPGPPQVQADRLGPGQALALVTDGFGDVIGQGNTLAGHYLRGAWERPLDPVDFLRSCSFLVAGGEDDRTAVLVWACP